MRADDSGRAGARAASAALALFAFYFLLACCYPAGMGFGDVKLAGLIGRMLGFLSYPALLVGAFAAFLIGGAVGAGGHRVATWLAQDASCRSVRSCSLGALLAIFASARSATSTPDCSSAT